MLGHEHERPTCSQVPPIIISIKAKKSLCQHYAKKSVQKTDVQTTTTRVITAVIGMIYEYLDRNYSCLEALNILCTKWDKEYVNEKRLPIITKSCSVLVSTQDMVSPDDIRPTDGLGKSNLL
jgi:hypothetical protein